MAKSINDVISRTNRAIAVNEQRCRESYEELLRQVVEGEELDPEKLSAVMAAVGKSLNDFRTDAATLAARFDAVQVLEGRDSRIQELSSKSDEATAEVTAAEQEMLSLKAAYERFLELQAKWPALENNRRVQLSYVSGMRRQAEDFLRQSAEEVSSEQFRDPHFVRIWNRRTNQPHKFR